MFNLQVIPLQFSKLWLSNAGGNNIVVIKCINEKDWNVKFSKNNGAFAFTEGWSKVVADLSLTEGCILLFRQLNPFNYLLTPFFKETPYPCCDPKLSLFTSISSLPNRKYIESFCHVFNDQCFDTLLALFDVNGSDVSIPRIGLQVNSNSDIRNAAPLVNNVDAVEDEVDMNSDFDPEFDEDDVEDSSGPSDDDKRDPDYEPCLNTKVASMARVDVSRKMTIQNLVGVDTVVTFRPEKHGGGFRYVANG
ncbi:putative transcription factor B3-Domain family [Helianthus debilis subsp. tardiflorus]